MRNLIKLTEGIILGMGVIPSTLIAIVTWQEFNKIVKD